MKPLAIARQSRRPSGLLGHIVGRVMARETQEANRTALAQLALKAEDQLLEVGCGHGWTLEAAAHTVTSGRVTGIDPSDVMLKIARTRNGEHIREGRVELIRGSTDNLPLPDGAFNKALTVHTIYFWLAPERDFAEILRVLVPGGYFLVGYRPGEDPGFAREYPSEVYHIRMTADVECALDHAGFVDVHTEIVPTGFGLLALTEAWKSLDR